MRKMKYNLFLIFLIIVISSGCIEQKTNEKSNTNNAVSTVNINNILNNSTSGIQYGIKIGDKVSIDYITIIDGEIVDTTNETLAKENNAYIQNRTYKPLSFVVGKEKVIKGLEEGVIGMRRGESRELIIPPEKAYGVIDPAGILTIPVTQKISLERNFSKYHEFKADEFDADFGLHKIGDEINLPYSNVNFTVLEMNETIVKAEQKLNVGDKVKGLAPWNETVVSIGDYVVLKADVKKNDIIHLREFPWNSTVIDIDSKNMTLRHNIIPDRKMMTSEGFVRVHFNDSYITLNRNHEYAGKTVNINITIIGY